MTGSALPANQAFSPAVSPAPADSAVKLSLTGNASQTYVIEASMDLTHWTAISTNATDVNGQFTAADPNAKNFPARFYRGVIPPR